MMKLPPLRELKMVCHLYRVSTVIMALALVASNAAAQQLPQAPTTDAPFAFGQTPDGNQLPQGQPQPFQGQPMPNQGASPVLSLVGAWSGQQFGPMGASQQNDYFAPDGTFVTAVRLANGMMVRAWGIYRGSPAGQNQLRVDLQLRGWLPQQMCQQYPGGSPNCVPFQLPQADTVLVTFTTPNTIQSISQTLPGPPLLEQREANPALLQEPVPKQAVMNVPQPSYQPQPNYQPQSGGYHPTPPSGPKCDDLQQRRVCNINDGHLVSSGGCLVCVSP